MMKKHILIIILSFTACVCSAQSPADTLRLTLGQAVDLARVQSPEIVAARHSFRASYWNYCYYKANYLPSLSLTSSPYFNHQINVVTQPDGTSRFVEQNQLTTDIGLSLSQNIPWTGGRLTLRSSLKRLDLLGQNRSNSYQTVPLSVIYEQSLFGYNSLKWDRRIEPLRFEEAKRNYVESLELVAAYAARMFFNLAQAQTNLDIARTNYATADTLYMYAQGRYGIGTVTENEMLQLEVNRLNEESNMLNALLAVDDAVQNLRTYLGITDSAPIKVIVDGNLPAFSVDMDLALDLALQNSPDITAMDRRLIESESNVAYARSQAGLKADIYAQVGLAQTGANINSAYSNPLNQQLVQVGLSIPILDWGRGKGRIKVARSNHEVVSTQVEQALSDFKINVTKAVRQFNLQNSRVNVASRTEETSVRRHDVALKLYLSKKASILDLNAAITEKDAAKRNYISTLNNYWTWYYTIRSLTLYDFEKNIPITEDYELLIK